jgi:phosphoserine phosphatase
MPSHLYLYHGEIYAKDFFMRFFISLLLLFSLSEATEHLASWNEGKSKQDIIHYVNSVTDPKSKDFIPMDDRIAVFDNDGTLWSERPIYFQLYFAIDRVKALAVQHPEWKNKQPFKAALEDDKEALLASGEQGLLELVMATHTGMSSEAFDAIVKAWIGTAEHPRFKRPFKELVYEPMLELLIYLRAKGFKTFIVSGGGIDFMRPWASEVYGVPSEQIVGSTVAVTYEKGKIIRQPKLNRFNDKEGKPEGIHYHIGKRPVAAFGNSDGDLAMMQYTEANRQYKTLQLYVHHTDEKREWRYDRDSHIGRLDKGLDYAKKHNWTVVDMQKEWKIIYPYEKQD